MYSFGRICFILYCTKGAILLIYLCLCLFSSTFNLWHTLTHWGRVTHIYISRLNIIGSNNGLSHGRRQAIIRTNAGILSNWPLGANFSEMLIEIYAFSFKKMHVKMSSAKRWPFCLGLNVLTVRLLGCLAWSMPFYSDMASYLWSNISNNSLWKTVVYRHFWTT